MYDAQRTLDAITDHAPAVVVVGGVSILAMFVFFVEAARMGQRDRLAPMALWMTVLWWPHDGSYLLHFHDWFSKYDHWFMELFWFAIVVTFAAECVYMVQTIRFGRDELSPGQSQNAHALRMVGALAAGVVSWALLKDFIDDPLYLLSFMSTLLWGCPSCAALLARRRDGRGQSVLEWKAFAVMAIMYSIASIGFFGGGFFHSWKYVALCVLASGWSLVNVSRVIAVGAVRSSWAAAREPEHRAAQRGDGGLGLAGARMVE